MSREKDILITAIAVVASAALSGCGSGDRADGSRPPARQTAAAALPQQLIGVWTRTFRRREVETEGFPTGTYTLKIRNGELDVYEGNGTHPNRDCISQAECTVVELKGTGKILTMGETGTCVGTARYAFVVKADTLTTRKIHDDCSAGRPLVFDRRTWKRAGS